MEDAYPLLRYSFELSTEYRRLGVPDESLHLIAPELGFGFARGAHASVRLLFVGAGRRTASPDARHPRAAVSFDNLHMMHDIISDILASDRVPRALKTRTIEAALAEFRDGSKNVMSMSEWMGMPEQMGGVERIGGVAWTPPIR